MGEPAFDLAAYREQVFDKAPDLTVVPPVDFTDTETPEATAAIPIETATTPVVTTSIENVPPVIKEDVAIVDDKVYLQQQLGYDDWNKAKQDLEELKRLRETPPTPAEIAFANEESKRIHELIRNGQEEKVLEYLQAKKTVSNLDSMSEEQQLKLYLKMQNPKFDDELVDYKHQQLYKLDESSFTNEEGEVDPFKQRLAKVELAQRIENDILKAKEYFAQYKTKIDLPDIAPPTSAQSEADIQAYQQELKEQEAANARWGESLTKLSENDIALKFSFNDEANKIKFDVDYKMDKVGFEKARVSALDYGKYAAETYAEQDGSPIADKFVRDIYVAQNLEKIVSESNKQAVNSTIKWFLANQKNIGDGVQRNYSAVEPSEIDEIRSKVFGKS